MLTLPPSLQALPDSARLWLLALEPAPAPEALPGLLDGLAAILAQWRHKGHAYQGAMALLHDRILAVAEPDLAANPSGCAIDGMLRKVDRLVAEQGLRTVDPAVAVLVRTPEGLRVIPKGELEGALAEGTLGPDTAVVDLALYSLGDLRAGRLESPLASTWIGRKFKVA
jgi:hypothetical protein